MRGLPIGASSGSPSPLLDVLGASWALGAPVAGVAWDGDLAGFGLGDGSLAMGRAQWQGGPQLEPVEGGTRLIPATQAQPPATRLRVHDGACLAIARHPGGGFLTGGDDGVLAGTDAEGTVTVLARQPGRWIDLVASGASGWTAAASGRQVALGGLGQHMLDLPATATALAFDAGGGRLAIAHYRGVTLWSPDAPVRVLVTPGCPLSLAWSQDSAYLVAGLQENALHGWRLSDAGDIEMGGYPGQPRSLSFSAGGRILASSGAPRVVCWRFDPPGEGSTPIECGLPSSRLPVCRVACHPTRPLIAAGYHNGAVLLCQPGSDDVLFVKSSGGGSVTALAWSDDGERLALGTQGGEAGLIPLPGLLFRFASSDPTSTPASGAVRHE
ncbi:WD40 repeat domain-containing protein [Lichenicoccus roseus]|uniref:WD40 repeat domain-containing protein n=1 Tax=Lichenicoccus roseus TaxID=2683649 RepID=A0A5R9J5C5_9PROT|nr:WD40 repeat domain-containing protein [Lichenicoccus roseus]TLU72159.1 WD40 repeat domain-containing protein [Lichenicoccus roseus]